jgi:hypothetical protein
MSETLALLRDLIQHDIGQRGLRTDPANNLVTATSADFALACRSIAEHPRPALVIVTGFFIPTAHPPAGETDGPLGALHLARALLPLGIPIALATDAFCVPALQAGLAACALQKHVPLLVLPGYAESQALGPDRYRAAFRKGLRDFAPSHRIALERVGPSHTLASLQAQLQHDGALGQTYLDFVDAVPEDHQDRCHTMRGIDLTERISPAHWLFESVAETTIGIGDGGNEIGMGRLSWEIIHRNIPNGGLVACRVRTRHLIVAGVSNWGAYALAAGVAHLRGKQLDRRLYDPALEQRILELMVKHGPLVDGVVGRPQATVDGLTWPQYSAVLQKMGTV